MFIENVSKSILDFSTDAEMTNLDEAVRVLSKSNPLQQVSLIRENEPDEMDAEQTFPTDEEIAAAQAGKFVIIRSKINNYIRTYSYE